MVTPSPSDDSDCSYRHRLHPRMVCHTQDEAGDFSFLAVRLVPVGRCRHLAFHRLASAHMVEHLLLMSFAPPLLLLGYPTVPLLRVLPRRLTRVLGPLFRVKSLRWLGHFLTTLVVAWIVMNFTFLGWHIPGAYDFALEHEHWHEFEHLCFLGSSTLFQ